MQSFPLNLLTFPLWWYTVGLKAVLRHTKKNYHYNLQKTGLLVFARHLSEPLYGDYTRTGIILSFFLRIILLAFKLLAFFFRILLSGLFVLLYLALLPAIILMITVQLISTK